MKVIRNGTVMESDNPLTVSQWKKYGLREVKEPAAEVKEQPPKKRSRKQNEQ